ncbi:TPA: hypothetical protein TVJ88_001099 [Streptococcus equi subsp. zooepidemicus]|uniref:hypothetical protein n=1 Tax=Streptococcus equi TaxID=1336 RepID=UPI001980E13B|nr:hypothetical protein [Streptococcus equi]QUQ79935.1 hypothetical protein LJFMMFNO_00940 [Streptococcus equi subsp. zooepidemicus]HEL0778711.1 hypothetical protein [Streptococcus equi subsp. zooepidemicus]HEL1069668.1 hypothetical protein [Streptococcus equi subsp. zooepidemicus]HEL1136609.1 hypothetical protein [Streptococcus equi subsp. zooepidemicus]HEL1281036.1 hypothetical protein [Streptococcus equi subsp. zooepidemicus]
MIKLVKIEGCYINPEYVVGVWERSALNFDDLDEKVVVIQFVGNREGEELVFYDTPIDEVIKRLLDD